MLLAGGQSRGASGAERCTIVRVRERAPIMGPAQERERLPGEWVWRRWQVGYHGPAALGPDPMKQCHFLFKLNFQTNSNL
jgi:hypothetical protein